MSVFRRLGHELTKPRGPSRHRFYRSSRRSQAGIALLIVIASILFMTVLVTEIAFAASVRMELAAHQRDEVKAQALATSGVNFYRLILVASKAIGKNPMIQQVQQALGINLGDSLWQMVPAINTGMMRMIFVTGGDVEDTDVQQFKEDGLTDEQVAQSREDSGFKHNFLDFDGDFAADVTDEDSKINISSFKATNFTDLQTDPTAVQLNGLMSGIRQCPGALDASGLSGPPDDRDDLDAFFYERNLDRWQLIGNLVDWEDADNVQIYRGGPEDVLYNTIEPDPYLPKNAGFDTLQEVRLVDGWNRDDVWDKFGGSLTTYGTGKININTAQCDVVYAMLKSYIQPPPSDDMVLMLMQKMQEQKALSTFSSGQQLSQFLASQGVTVDPKLASAVTTESKVFRVTSTGQVGKSEVTIEAVIDFSSSQIGKIVYWKVE